MAKINGAITGIKFNSNGFRQVLLSDGVKAKIEEEAQKIADRATAKCEKGQGYYIETEYTDYGRGRWKTSVIPIDDQTQWEEHTKNVLSGSVQ